ncbi:MAG: hypothetical protein ACF8MJ_10465 [Phycisphaerales bacterium JB050]
MPKGTTKPGDEHDTGTGNDAGTGTGTDQSTQDSPVEPNAVAIRAATSGDDEPSTPSIPDLLDRVRDIEAQLASLLDDLAVALPDLRAPAPISSRSVSPSGAYAPQPAETALEALRDRAASGDRTALMRYLRLRRS